MRSGNAPSSALRRRCRCRANAHPVADRVPRRGDREPPPSCRLPVPTGRCPTSRSRPWLPSDREARPQFPRVRASSIARQDGQHAGAETEEQDSSAHQRPSRRRGARSCTQARDGRDLTPGADASGDSHTAALAALSLGPQVAEVAAVQVGADDGASASKSGSISADDRDAGSCSGRGGAVTARYCFVLKRRRPIRCGGGSSAGSSWPERCCIQAKELSSLTASARP